MIEICRFRCNLNALARALSEQSIGQDHTVLNGIGLDVSEVLDDVGTSGAHPAFLQQMLVGYGYDQSVVARDLLGGCPLILLSLVESSTTRIDAVVPDTSAET